MWNQNREQDSRYRLDLRPETRGHENETDILLVQDDYLIILHFAVSAPFSYYSFIYNLLKS